MVARRVEKQMLKLRLETLLTLDAATEMIMDEILEDHIAIMKILEDLVLEGDTSDAEPCCSDTSDASDTDPCNARNADAEPCNACNAEPCNACNANAEPCNANAEPCNADSIKVM